MTFYQLCKTIIDITIIIIVTNYYLIVINNKIKNKIENADKIIIIIII